MGAKSNDMDWNHQTPILTAYPNPKNYSSKFSDVHNLAYCDSKNQKSLNDRKEAPCSKKVGL